LRPDARFVQQPCANNININIESGCGISSAAGPTHLLGKT
jgi:hypothetical protein